MSRALWNILLFTLCIVPLTAEENAPFSWELAGKTFTRYCKACHGKTTPDADLDLVTIDHQRDLIDYPEKWVKIRQALRTYYMPHPEGKELPLEQRQALINLIQTELIKQSAQNDSTSAPLRRLNRAEFNNTLNDLFFTDIDWAQSLPADDAGYGFDNIAASLNFSPLLLERYFDAAARAALIAVPQKIRPTEWSLSASNFSGGYKNTQSVTIASSGKQAAAKHSIFFPAKGSYQVEFLLNADQAGDENARAEIWINGQAIDRHEITAKRSESPQTIHQTFSIDAYGEHKIEIRLLNDFYRKTVLGKQDRNLIFHGIKIKGPQQSPADLTSPFLDRHFGSAPEALSQKELKNGIYRFASRAYRRPITPEEGDDLWNVFKQNSQRDKNSNGIRQGLYGVIDAVLTSPSFLFRFEANSEKQALPSFALASWLSYFLWSSMPDDRLFELALKNELESNLDAEISRMLADPKAAALAQNFGGQWWRFRDLDIHRPDKNVYKNADHALLRAMKEENQRFFSHVLKQDKPLTDFLSANYTFLNERLAKHYQIDGVKGAHFRKVSLQDTPRRGIWGQAGILTLTSHPNHTSPVLRGQWMLENLIGLSPPPPPDNIPSLPGTEGKPDPSDLRASLAQHREDPDCASCHDIMDPFGLALEHFNGVGGLRSLEERKKLSSETLFDGTIISDPIELADYLATNRSEDFCNNLARKLSIYASGRGLNWSDEAALNRITESTQTQDYRFSALIHAVVYEFAPIQKTASVTQVDTSATPQR